MKENYTTFASHTSQNDHQAVRKATSGKGKSEWQRSAIRVCGHWSEQLSSKGKTYFYNCDTEVSQWQKPPEWTLPDMSKKELAAYLARQKDDEVSHLKRTYSSANANNGSKESSESPSKRMKSSFSKPDNPLSYSTGSNSGVYSKSGSSGIRRYDDHARNHPSRDQPQINGMMRYPNDDMDISPGSSPLSGRATGSHLSNWQSKKFGQQLSSPSLQKASLEQDIQKRNYSSLKHGRNNSADSRGSSKTGTEAPTNAALKQLVDVLRESLGPILSQSPAQSSNVVTPVNHNQTDIQNSNCDYSIKLDGPNSEAAGDFNLPQKRNHNELAQNRNDTGNSSPGKYGSRSSSSASQNSSSRTKFESAISVLVNLLGANKRGSSQSLNGNSDSVVSRSPQANSSRTHATSQVQLSNHHSTSVSPVTPMNSLGSRRITNETIHAKSNEINQAAGSTPQRKLSNPSISEDKPSSMSKHCPFNSRYPNSASDRHNDATKNGNFSPSQLTQHSNSSADIPFSNSRASATSNLGDLAIVLHDALQQNRLPNNVKSSSGNLTSNNISSRIPSHISAKSFSNSADTRDFNTQKENSSRSPRNWSPATKDNNVSPLENARIRNNYLTKYDENIDEGPLRVHTNNVNSAPIGKPGNFFGEPNSHPNRSLDSRINADDLIQKSNSACSGAGGSHKLQNQSKGNGEVNYGSSKTGTSQHSYNSPSHQDNPPLSYSSHPMLHQPSHIHQTPSLHQRRLNRSIPTSLGGDLAGAAGGGLGAGGDKQTSNYDASVTSRNVATTSGTKHYLSGQQTNGGQEMHDISLIIDNAEMKRHVDSQLITRYRDAGAEKYELEAQVEAKKFDRLQSVLYSELSGELKKLRALVRISGAKLSIHKKKKAALQEVMELIESYQPSSSLSFAEN